MASNGVNWRQIASGGVRWRQTASATPNWRQWLQFGVVDAKLAPVMPNWRRGRQIGVADTKLASVAPKLASLTPFHAMCQFLLQKLGHLTKLAWGLHERSLVQSSSRCAPLVMQMYGHNYTYHHKLVLIHGNSFVFHDLHVYWSASGGWFELMTFCASAL